jgi:hypothetical protein
MPFLRDLLGKSPSHRDERLGGAQDGLVRRCPDMLIFDQLSGL